MANLRVEFPLGSLPPAEAKARLVALGDYLQNRHGINVTWRGESAEVRGKYMVVSIEGAMSLTADQAVFEGKDPGFLWRGKAKEYLGDKLAKYLNPATKLEDLPRR